MLNYIREAKTPKHAWGELKKVFPAITTTRQQMNNIQKRDMWIDNYSLKLINVNIDDDEMV